MRVKELLSFWDIKAGIANDSEQVHKTAIAAWDVFPPVTVHAAAIAQGARQWGDISAVPVGPDVTGPETICSPNGTGSRFCVRVEEKEG